MNDTFHQNRTTFVLLFLKTGHPDLEACMVLADDEKRSHAEWFEAIKDELPGDTTPPTIEEAIRGYWDETGIYFYQGPDFHGGPEVKKYAERYVRSVRDLAGKPRDTRVFVGVRPGVPGEHWEPLEELGA
jgi:hypothetical protein